jgi:5-methylcytosine-specific restriction endonuclease McrA
LWEYQNLSDYEIAETLGAQIRGLVNYYALAVNLGTGLNSVRWACMESARKTLAAKHRIRQRSITSRRYYHKGTYPQEWKHIRVVIERDDKPSLIAKCGETPLRTRKTTYANDTIPPMVIAGMTSELLTRLLKGECELCSRKDTLQAYHVHKLKHLRKR